jgi:predicted metal-binding protein
MARIGILTCSNATDDLGCSSVSCLADFRKRQGPFSKYPAEEKLTLVGIISCAGCPTLCGPDKLLQRIRGLTAFHIHAIHFSNCVMALCPFRKQYAKAIRENYPEVDVVSGSHTEHISAEEFRNRTKKLFCQQQKSMIDMILNSD